MSFSNKRVLVFAERGADPHMLCQTLRASFARASAAVDVVPVTAAQMREPGMMDPDNTIGFFLPGALSADYDTKLGADNIEALRNYVTQGGSFMGICAGAYYACSRIEWYAGDKDRAKRKNPGIDFFEYEARGPIRELVADDDAHTENDRTLSHAAPVGVTWRDGKTEKRTEILYWGGPRLDKGSKGEVLAKFNGLSGHPPAIVMRSYGMGKAMISSAHPELSGRDFARYVHGPGALQDRARAVGRHLEQHESGRQALWDHMMKRLFPALMP